jgi:hypothetical protein
LLGGSRSGKWSPQPEALLHVFNETLPTTGTTMHVTQLGQKLRAQIQEFSGIISPRFSKPKGKFIEQMLLGLRRLKTAS